jgi:hypothetical protein
VIPAAPLGAVPPWHLMVIPPPAADGIASMLVALGNAQIVVVSAAAVADEPGVYDIALDHPEQAISVLSAVGCQVQSLQRVVVG